MTAKSNSVEIQQIEFYENGNVLYEREIEFIFPLLLESYDQAGLREWFTDKPWIYRRQTKYFENGQKQWELLYNEKGTCLGATYWTREGRKYNPWAT